MPDDADWFDVAAEADLIEGRPLAARALGRPLLVLRHAGVLHALDGLCTHGGGDLCAGQLGPDGSLQCPRHGGRFDLASGHAIGEPATDDLTVHAARIEAGRVQVCLARPRGAAEAPGHLKARADAFQRRHGR